MRSSRWMGWFLAIGCGSSVALPAGAANNVHTKPVIPSDFADPAVAYDPQKGIYCAFGTESFFDPIKKFQRRCSDDLYDWGAVENPLDPDGNEPDDGLPGWVSTAPGEPRNLWAPALHRFGSTWVLYFAALEENRFRNCIGVATADSLDGDFEARPAPIVCPIPPYGVDKKGAIDPEVITSGTKAYLLWKNETNVPPANPGEPPASPAEIEVKELAPDGLSTVGPGQVVLTPDATWAGGWEDFGTGPYIENPFMVRDGSRFLLFYSGDDWTTASYAVGYADCDTPMGPCTRVSTAGPWLSGDATAQGTAGASAFIDPWGDPWLVYHAWGPGAPGYPSNKRGMHLQRLNLVASPPTAQIAPGPMARTLIAWPPITGLGHYNFDVQMAVNPSPPPGAEYRWLHHFAFVHGGDGYIGLENAGLVPFVSQGRTAVFSIYGEGLEAFPGPGATCLTLGDRKLCRKPFAWQPGKAYKLRVWICCGAPPEREGLAAWIIDPETGEETVIAWMQFPSEWNHLGNLTLVSADFLGGVDTCNQVPKVYFAGLSPSVNGPGTNPPTTSGNWSAGLCPNASAGGAIHQSGVLYATGGDGQFGACGLGGEVALLLLPLYLAKRWRGRSSARSPAR